jgi:tetratricopeptide (TPR) repeat protein
VESIHGSQGALLGKATLSGFETEVTEEATKRASETKDYFEAGERDFAARRYRDAASNFQKSIDALPTISAYLNLGLSFCYTSEYQQARGIFTTAEIFDQTSITGEKLS